MDQHERDVQQRIHHALFGNGQPGLMVRVDRLEQARLSAKERWALYVACAAALFNALPVKEWLENFAQ
jgi:hypothetical protein